MIRKGIYFRHSRKIVSLPNRDEQGNLMPYVEPGKEHYVYFGVICSRAKPLPKNAVKTGWRWDDGLRDFVWAVPLKDQVHSLTNMVYQGDRVLLMADGRCYSGKAVNAKMKRSGLTNY